MAVGRDVYADTRMILQRLEEMFPPSAEHPSLSSKETAGIAALLNKFVVDAGVFSNAAALMPPDGPAARNPKFMADRAAFMGRKEWTAAHLRLGRPEALVHMRQCFDIVESLFADGRKWVAETDGLSFADIESSSTRQTQRTRT